MGWFNKSKEEGKKEPISLPDLPKLPELPRLDFEKFNSDMPQLPTFPTNSVGERFSQNAIKDAVSGKEDAEEFDKDDFDEEEFDEDEKRQIMQKPIRFPMTKEILEETPAKQEIRKTLTPKIKEEFSREPIEKNFRKDPVFIRVDKFEEGLKTFGQAKEKISELETMLRDIKKIKDQEEKELETWEVEIQSIKSQIEKVDRDIFSKIE